MNIQIKSSITTYITKFIKESNFNKEMQVAVLKLLQSNGKLLHEETVFSWGEFSFLVFSLFDDNEYIENKLASAAAIELLILSTDLIDDLVDEDISAECLTIVSEKEALMLANALLIESIRLLVKYSIKEPNDAYFRVNQLLLHANNGQWKDMSFTVDGQLKLEEEYFKLIEKKSCSLIQLIFDLFNMSGDFPINEIPKYIGYSWQIKNDVRNIISNEKSDILFKKATLPIIKALEYSFETDKGQLVKMFEGLHSNTENLYLITKIEDYIKKSGAIDYCCILEKIYIQKSKKMIKGYFLGKDTLIEQLFVFLD